MKKEVHILCANHSTSCANVRKRMVDLGFNEIVRHERTEDSDHYGVIDVASDSELEKIVSNLYDSVGPEFIKLHVKNSTKN